MLQNQVEPQVLWDSTNKLFGLNLGGKAVPPGLGSDPLVGQDLLWAAQQLLCFYFAPLLFKKQQNQTSARVNKTSPAGNVHYHLHRH